MVISASQKRLALIGYEARIVYRKIVIMEKFEIRSTKSETNTNVQIFEIQNCFGHLNLEF